MFTSSTRICANKNDFNYYQIITLTKKIYRPYSCINRLPLKEKIYEILADSEEFYEIEETVSFIHLTVELPKLFVSDHYL